MIRTGGSPTSTTSSVTRPRCWWRGSGCRANRGSRSAGVDGETAYHVEQVLGVRAVPGRAPRGAAVRELPAAAGPGAADPQAWRQAPPARDPDDPRSGRAGGPQAGAGADLRGRLSAVLLRVPAGTPGAGRDRRGAATSRSRSYEWIVEADIEACFDELDHSAIMDRVRRRIADKRVLALIKAFLKAGIMTEQGRLARAVDRHPAGRDSDCSHAKGNLGHWGLWGWGSCVGS